jgi:4-hydroxy-3-methylbut-2-enyl diphosphate reductase
MSLAAICAERVPTYHIEDATCIEPDRGVIRFKPIGEPPERMASSWLPAGGEIRVGLTAGASTPNNKIGDAVSRIFATRGIAPEAVPV